MVTKAQRAREEKKRDPDLTPSQIAAKTGSTRQAVEKALSVTQDRPGRPGEKSESVRIASMVLKHARRAATKQKLTLRAWIEKTITNEIGKAS